jgi:hypothetical protein
MTDIHDDASGDVACAEAAFPKELRGPQRPENDNGRPEATAEGSSNTARSLGRATAHAHISTEKAEKSSDFATKMVENATELARQGFHVFPIAAGAKIPPITGWQELATTDPDEIPRVWTSEYWEAAKRNKSIGHAQADAERAERIKRVKAAPLGKLQPFNIGIFTGAPLPDGRRFFVLDYDTKGGEGYESATAQERHAQLVAKVGKENLPSTYTARTATKGAHAIYVCPPGVEVASDVGLIPGVDVRGRGAYIVAPGSILDKGGAYRWANNGSPSEIEGAEASDALLALCKAVAQGTLARALDAAGNIKALKGSRSIRRPTSTMLSNGLKPKPRNPSKATADTTC